jgi:hypothetical protein
MTSNATPCLAGSQATSNTVTITVNTILNASVSIAGIITGLSGLTPGTYYLSNTAGAIQTTAGTAYDSQFGNSTAGIFALGFNGASTIATRNKYTYSGCVSSCGTAASIAARSGSATGNSTVGIFALGRNSCGTAVSTRDKYTYSGCVNSSATSASAASYYGTAAGNSTTGIFSLGCVAGSASAVRDKYTYSGCVNASATAASVASYAGSAASNGTTGVNV